MVVDFGGSFLDYVVIYKIHHNGPVVYYLLVLFMQCYQVSGDSTANGPRYGPVI